MKNKYLTASTIIEKYDKIKYRADDDRWYKLNKYYPLCFKIARKKNAVWLDTGGEMDGCDFDEFRFTETELFRGEDKVLWAEIKHG
jgi:hypothetical protein